MSNSRRVLALALSGVSMMSYAADDLIITEYVEGSSLNKAVEIYNPTSASIDLSAYQLDIYFNGSTSANTRISLSGNLAAGDVYVVADDGADPAILAVTDLTSSASFFNGDDAIVLQKNGTVVDSLGQVGVDPGSEWGSGDLSTANNTLRRTELTADTIVDDAVTLAGWEGFANDTFDDLGNYDGGTTPPPPPPVDFACDIEATAIHAVQGSGDASPLVNTTADVQAVVTAVMPGLKGLYVQTPDADVDADAATSEGLFIYLGTTDISYQAGDLVRFRGQVTEFYNLTQLGSISDELLCGSDQVMPSSVSVSLPVTEVGDLEAFEGMLVKFPQNLVVNDVYNLARFGEVILGSSRHYIGTQVAEPGAPALAVSAANAKDSIVMDDNQTAQNPDPVVYPAPELSAANTLRVGDSVTDLDGVLHYSFSKYRVMPTETVNVVHTNARTEAPSLEGNLKVASFNVLNYFNGDGVGGGFPTPRGADTAEEFTRQRDKIINAMLAINADVFGLMEIENDGYGADSAIADLVNGLNAAAGSTEFAYLNPGVSQIGTDAIAVGIIYRPAVVSPQGAASILDSGNSPLDADGQPLFLDTKNRPMLTQAFTHVATDESMVVAVNHLKSKGSNCDSLGDPDQGDGQGNCNLTRTRAAEAIHTWLASEYPEQAIVVMGDLNAYAMEDPVTELESAGYENLFTLLEKPDEYSYVFSGETGSLDHALLNAALAEKLVDGAHWNINADEPRALDYNTEFKSSSQQIDWYAADAYRSSDHDPVILSLDMTPTNALPEAAFEYQANRNRVRFTSTSTDSDGEIVNWMWDFGDGSTGSGEQVNHRFGASGDYQVTLTVTDNAGGQASVTQTVTVDAGRSPVARVYHASFFRLHFFLSRSYDPDGRVVSHNWEFNDGTVRNSRFAIYRGRDADEVTLTVTDDNGLQDSTSVNF
ncbi:ExeM/NucH family extracellular endonuclease [Shewanella submarina]|uniref:ExeM/NucH family extracellular endonuclease n=1 Tax=Shewanella submarina TaxID=2016376 RepID=A0ABV7G9U9_9GAMM|nr:ExeM/NucH family extracellular endonuclease [Shewanella submarina]MCL1039724.1 ExeM/NucH family extracellular endonuclease [Shewanella submarina]